MCLSFLSCGCRIILSLNKQFLVGLNSSEQNNRNIYLRLNQWTLQVPFFSMTMYLFAPFPRPGIPVIARWPLQLRPRDPIYHHTAPSNRLWLKGPGIYSIRQKGRGGYPIRLMDTTLQCNVAKWEVPLAIRDKIVPFNLVKS